MTDMHVFQRPEAYDLLTFNSGECWYFNYVKKTIDQEMMNQSQKRKYAAVAIKQLLNILSKC